MSLYDRGRVALSRASGVVGAHVGTVDGPVTATRPLSGAEPGRRAVSKQLKAAGEALGVQLVDSLVCGFDGRYTSLGERGLT